MESVKIDVSKISAEDAAEVIADSLFPKYNNGKDRNKGNPKTMAQRVTAAGKSNKQ